MKITFHTNNRQIQLGGSPKRSPDTESHFATRNFLIGFSERFPGVYIIKTFLFFYLMPSMYMDVYGIFTYVLVDVY